MVKFGRTIALTKLFRRTKFSVGFYSISRGAFTFEANY